MADQKLYTNKLEGQHILIIGGSSGIGFGVAEACLEFGAHVIISSSQQSRIDNAISRLLKSYPSAKSRLTGYASNLADEHTLESNIQTLFAQVTNNGQQKLDHIVYTAGSPLKHTALKEATVEMVKQAGMVRFFGPMFVAKHGQAHLHAGPHASIVLTSGTASERPYPGWSSGSINGGMHMLNRNLALEFAPVRVNLISPGAVDTEIWDSFPQAAREGIFRDVVAKLPTGRIGRVQDVVEAYLYAMKDENLTGTLISTNGGTLLVG